MKKSILGILTLFPLLALASAELPRPTGESILSPDARLELLFSRAADPNFTSGLTEGPAVAPDGTIYFTDYPLFEPVPGRIMRFDPKTMKTEIFSADSGKANGLKFDSKGRLLACEGADNGGRQVSRWDVQKKTKVTLANRYQGKAFNAPNDVCLDRKGRIYFSDPRYLGPETMELPMAVYRIDLDGTVSEVTRDFEKPNGVALSPDGKTLYVGDHNNGTVRILKDGPTVKKGEMKVWAFPLDAEGRVAGQKRLMYDFGTENGCDGMVVDSEGNLYLTARSLKRPGVLVLNPKGKEIAFIPTGPSQPSDSKQPTGIPSNVTFGIGKEIKTLYITVDTSLYRIPLKVAGYHPW